MMPGMIMLWHGTVGNIPSGWHLCDGSMGTPDLRSRYIPCAHAAFPPGSMGGTTTHTHAFTGDGHSHTIPEGTGLMAGTDYALETESDPAVGDTDAAQALQPYYALCYIMKL